LHPNRKPGKQSRRNMGIPTLQYDASRIWQNREIRSLHTAASPTPHLRPRTESHAVLMWLSVLRIRTVTFFTSHRAKKRAGWHRGSNFPLSFPFAPLCPSRKEAWTVEWERTDGKNCCLPPGATDPTPPRTMLPSSELRNHPGGEPFFGQSIRESELHDAGTQISPLSPSLPPFCRLESAP